jgi:hypothetical protein
LDGKLNQNIQGIFFFLFLIAFLCEINAIEVLGRELKTSAQLQGGREEGITKVNQKKKRWDHGG